MHREQGIPKWEQNKKPPNTKKRPIPRRGDTNKRTNAQANSY